MLAVFIPFVNLINHTNATLECITEQHYELPSGTTQISLPYYILEAQVGRNRSNGCD